MNLIIEVFKMFPPQKQERLQNKRKTRPKKKNMKALFAEGFQEGCDAFTKEMGYPQKQKR